MKELKVVVTILFVMSIVICWHLISDYDEIDDYNQMSNRYSWVSDLGSDAIGVGFKGNKGQYYISVNSNKGLGVIDKNGEVILPCEYFAVEYKFGDYMAAATADKWILMDLDGKEVSSFNRISFPYAYAGDKYFLKYGNDAFENSSDGFTIIDAVSGDIVKEYNDYYNAVRLDDGNWYISKTVVSEMNIATRMVLTSMNWYSVNYSEEDAKVVPKGFFVDENFKPLYEGKEYQLVCQGNGFYVVKEIKQSNENTYIVLDESGELFEVRDEKLINRISKYEREGELGYSDIVTVFKGKDDSIGFASINNYYDVIYYSETGDFIGDSKISPNNYHIDDLDWVVFTDKDEYEIVRYGIKDRNNNTILPAIYGDLIFLPETENIMINSDVGCGIIRLEVN